MGCYGVTQQSWSFIPDGLEKDQALFYVPFAGFLRRFNAVGPAAVPQWARPSAWRQLFVLQVQGFDQQLSVSGRTEGLVKSRSGYGLTYGPSA